MDDPKRHGPCGSELAHKQFLRANEIQVVDAHELGAGDNAQTMRGAAGHHALDLCMVYKPLHGGEV